MNAASLDRRELAADNVRLAYSVAAALLRQSPLVRRLGRDDARSAALLGLANAARLFDPSRGWRFSTYATYACRNAVYHAARHGGVVSVPGTIHRHEACPFPKEFSRAVKAPRPVEVACLGTAPLRARFEDAEEVESLLANLTEAEAKVVRLVFLEGLTLKEVGDRMGFSKERARQIREEAMLRLRLEARG